MVEHERANGVHSIGVHLSSSPCTRPGQLHVRLAGCDVFTVPCEILREFLGQTEVPPGALTSQLETSYDDRLDIGGDAIRAVGHDRIARLWRVEPEFVEFLIDDGASAEYRRIGQGDRLWHRFEDAGFGDFFHSPDRRQWETLKKSKLPDLTAPLAPHIAVDTHMSRLADGDFVSHQEAIDAALLRCIANRPSP